MATPTQHTQVLRLLRRQELVGCVATLVRHDMRSATWMRRHDAAPQGRGRALSAPDLCGDDSGDEAGFARAMSLLSLKYS